MVLHTSSGMTDFPIVNFPYLSSKIPESPEYGVFVSQLPWLRYVRVCSKYEDFMFKRFYSGLKVIEAGIFFTETYLV